jgi:hypothetical protein
LSQTIKRIYLPKFHLSFIWLVAGFVILNQGCNTRVEGCLDVAAANFDLNADRACKDCCTYPTISIELSQKWNERNFSTSDTLMDIGGQPYKVIDLDYYLSSWSWEDAGNLMYTVDSASIECPGTMFHYTPDIIPVDSRKFLYTLGTIRKAPAIDSVHLLTGLIPMLDCVDAAASSTPPVLSNQSPMWDPHSSSRSSIRLVLQRNINSEIYDTVYIHSAHNLNTEYIFSFTYGSSPTLNLTVNYAQWFSNADVTDLNSFETSIVSGLKGSVFRTP